MMHRAAMRIASLVLLVAALVAGCGTPVPSGALQPSTIAALGSDLKVAWSAEPFGVTNHLRRNLDRTCKTGSAMQLGEEYPVVLVHARGGALVDVVYSNGRHFIVCGLAAAGDGVYGGGAEAINKADALPAPEGDVTVLHTVSTYAGRGRTSVVGIVDASFPRVRIVRDNGETIEAAVGGGIFAAWWPAHDESFLVEALDASGTVVAEERG